MQAGFLSSVKISSTGSVVAQDALRAALRFKLQTATAAIIMITILSIIHREGNCEGPLKLHRINIEKPSVPSCFARAFSKIAIFPRENDDF